MGGTVVIFKSGDVASALTSFAKDYGVTQVVMGRSQPRRGMRRFFPSIIDKLSQQLQGVDIIIS